jgi:hypothetical protein
MWVIWSAEPDLYQQYPKERLPQINDAEIVFIGSSLTAQCAAGEDSVSGVFGDQRTSVTLAVPGISERMTTRLVAHAIDSGAETVMVEINAYAHDYIEYSRNYPGLGEPLFTARLARYFRDLGERLTLNLKSLLFDPRRSPLAVHRNPMDLGNSTFDFKAVDSADYYRLLPVEPVYPDELGRVLERARSLNTQVFFFSPPRPLSVVKLIGDAEYARIIEHISTLARKFGVPVWYSPSGWPDDNFLDIHAHVNGRGRARFLHELANWYGGRR